MINEEAAWRKSMQLEQQRADGAAPNFSTIWQAAEASARPGRRYSVAVAATFLAVVAVATTSLLQSDGGVVYLDVDELMASTSWSAPSDSLLPQHEFDIYRDVVQLIESTEPVGEALP
jgi:hypothetical protein